MTIELVTEGNPSQLKIVSSEGDLYTTWATAAGFSSQPDAAIPVEQDGVVVGWFRGVMPNDLVGDPDAVKALRSLNTEVAAAVRDEILLKIATAILERK